MSWLFSQALVADFSEATSLAGAPCAPLNLMPTAQPFLRKGRTTDFSDLSPFGLTCEPLTEDLGAGVLTWFLQGFPARTSARPARGLVLKEPGAASGAMRSESFAKWNPAESSWRTAQSSLLGGSELFLETWPRSGSMRDGVCSRRAKLALSTFGSAGGASLPTPSGVNGGRNNTMGRIDEWGGSSNPLRGTVIGSMCLPEFEELVMGWPIGWTALTPLAMDRFQRWQRLHSPLWPEPSHDALVSTRQSGG